MKRALIASAMALIAVPASAEIVAASPDHYTLRHEATSELSTRALWNRLVHPASWWHPDHTYSGNASGLSLDARAGGLWREDWTGGSVSHGQVLYVKDGEQLRMSAPFGPLQSMAVNVVWTITITESETGGSVVVFDEVANGSSASGLNELASAVDFVKQEAITRLVTAD